MHNMKILFTGGGSGGHLFPIIAISRELRRLYDKENLKFYYIGPNNSQGLLELSQEPLFKIYHIAAGKMRRYFSLLNILDLLIIIPFSFLQSFFLLLFNRPNLVFSKGGTGSLPVAYAARLLFIPVFLHESDMVPGLSNQITSKWAKKIFISFEKTEYFDLSKTICTGTPIKKELLEGDTTVAKELFNLVGGKPVIMFWGGSQGAQPLNDFVILTLNELLRSYEVIHICGNKNLALTQSETDVMMQKDLAQYYHLYSELDEVRLKHAYKVASLIISRAGSASIFELAAVGKPTILIPLPSAAGDHQSKNAYAYAATDAAIVIEQENLTPHFFFSKIQYLLASPKTLESMHQAALAFAKPLAARAIAREILEYLQK